MIVTLKIMDRTEFGSTGFFVVVVVELIYLFWAALGLCCCARALSSCDELGLLPTTMRGPLTAVASPVSGHGL